MIRNAIAKLNTFKGPVIILTVAFLISRLILYSLDVTFYTTFIHRLWQAIDIHLLQTELARSLYYSHAQPPGFNFLVGVLAKLFPVKYPQVFHLLNLMLSFGAALLIFFSLIQLRISKPLATIIALLFLLNPSLLLYEKLFTYTILTIFLISLLLFFLISFLKTKSVLFFTCFCSTVAIVVLTRSSFHLFWMIVILLTTVFSVSKDFRKVSFFKVAIIFIMITSLWYIKNLFVFNTFSASSWMGMNMARIIPPPTPLGEIGPFKPLESYGDLFAGDSGFSGIAILNTKRKSTGHVNYYHKDYLGLSQQFREDVVHEVKVNPAGYLHEIGNAFLIYFSPATHGPFIDKNLKRIQPYGSWYNLDFTGFQRYQIQHPEKEQIYTRSMFLSANGFTTTGAVPAFAFYVLTFVSAMFCWWKNLFSSSDKLVVFVILLTVTYGMLVGNLLEFGENNRFRFEINTAMLILATFASSRIYHFFNTLNPHSKN